MPVIDPEIVVPCSHDLSGRLAREEEYFKCRGLSCNIDHAYGSCYFLASY